MQEPTTQAAPDLSYEQFVSSLEQLHSTVDIRGRVKSPGYVDGSSNMDLRRLYEDPNRTQVLERSRNIFGHYVPPEGYELGPKTVGMFGGMTTEGDAFVGMGGLEEVDGSPKTLGEVWKDFSMDELVPYWAGAKEAGELGRVWMAARDLEENQAQADPESFKLVQGWLADQQRKRTFWGGVGEIVAQMPAFVLEFLSSGSVYNLVKEGGERVAGKAIKELIENRLGGVLATRGMGVVGRLGDGLAKTAAMAGIMTPRAHASAWRRAMPDMVSFQDGELASIVMMGTGQEFQEALPAGYVDTWIEVLSERSGELVPMHKLPFASKLGIFQGSLMKRYLDKHPTRTTRDFLDMVSQESGWAKVVDNLGLQDPFTEVAEERVGDALRTAILGDDWDWPSAEQFAQELTAFTLLGAAKAPGTFKGQREAMEALERRSQVEEQQSTRNQQVIEGKERGAEIKGVTGQGVPVTMQQVGPTTWRAYDEEGLVDTTVSANSEREAFQLLNDAIGFDLAPEDGSLGAGVQGPEVAPDPTPVQEPEELDEALTIDEITEAVVEESMEEDFGPIEQPKAAEKKARKAEERARQLYERYEDVDSENAPNLFTAIVNRLDGMDFDLDAELALEEAEALGLDTSEGLEGLMGAAEAVSRSFEDVNEAVKIARQDALEGHDGLTYMVLDKERHKAAISKWHDDHHSSRPAINHRYQQAVAVVKDGEVVAVATMGTPSGPWAEKVRPQFIELHRVMSSGEGKNASSAATSAAIQLAKREGKTLVTYSEIDEAGTTYKALTTERKDGYHLRPNSIRPARPDRSGNPQPPRVRWMAGPLADYNSDIKPEQLAQVMGKRPAKPAPPKVKGKVQGDSVEAVMSQELGEGAAAVTPREADFGIRNAILELEKLNELEEDPADRRATLKLYDALEQALRSGHGVQAVVDAAAERGDLTGPQAIKVVREFARGVAERREAQLLEVEKVSDLSTEEREKAFEDDTLEDSEPQVVVRSPYGRAVAWGEVTEEGDLWVEVASDYEMMGLGTKVLDHLLRGRNSVFVKGSSIDEQAIAALANRGFQPVQSVRDMDADGRYEFFRPKSEAQKKMERSEAARRRWHEQRDKRSKDPGLTFVEWLSLVGGAFNTMGDLDSWSRKELGTIGLPPGWSHPVKPKKYKPGQAGSNDYILDAMVEDGWAASREVLDAIGNPETVILDFLERNPRKDAATELSDQEAAARAERIEQVKDQLNIDSDEAAANFVETPEGHTAYIPVERAIELWGSAELWDLLEMLKIEPDAGLIPAHEIVESFDQEDLDYADGWVYVTDAQLEEAREIPFGPMPWEGVAGPSVESTPLQEVLDASIDELVEMSASTISGKLLLHELVKGLAFDLEHRVDEAYRITNAQYEAYLERVEPMRESALEEGWALLEKDAEALDPLTIWYPEDVRLLRELKRLEDAGLGTDESGMPTEPMREVMDAQRKHEKRFNRRLIMQSNDPFALHERAYYALGPQSKYIAKRLEELGAPPFAWWEERKALVEAKSPNQPTRQFGEESDAPPTFTFASGLSRSPSDLEQEIAAGNPVGVSVRQPLSDRVVGMMADYANSGGQVFVDSGAFTALTQGGELDWPAVTERYLDLVERVEWNSLENVWIVAPDIVGDQDATEALRANPDSMAGILNSRARVIFPIQTPAGGDIAGGFPAMRAPLGAIWNSLTAEIDPDSEADLDRIGRWRSGQYVVGLPFNEKAWSTEAVVEFVREQARRGDFDPHIHLLGGGPTKVAAVMRALKEAGLDGKVASLTGDASSQIMRDRAYGRGDQVTVAQMPQTEPDLFGETEEKKGTRREIVDEPGQQGALFQEDTGERGQTSLLDEEFQGEKEPKLATAGVKVSNVWPGEEQTPDLYTGVATGQPTRLRAFRGSGRADADEVYAEGATGPLFGKAGYYALNRKHAEKFGPNVTEYDVELQNPYVIESVADVNRLTGLAGMPRQNKDRGRFFAAVRQYAEEAGHDGFIVNVPQYGDMAPDGSSIKQLREVFGQTQVVSLSGKANEVLSKEDAETKRGLDDMFDRWAEEGERAEGATVSEPEGRLGEVIRAEYPNLEGAEPHLDYQDLGRPTPALEGGLHRVLDRAFSDRYYQPLIDAIDHITRRQFSGVPRRRDANPNGAREVLFELDKLTENQIRRMGKDKARALLVRFGLTQDGAKTVVRETGDGARLLGLRLVSNAAIDMTAYTLGEAHKGASGQPVDVRDYWNDADQKAADALGYNALIQTAASIDVAKEAIKERRRERGSKSKPKKPVLGFPVGATIKLPDGEWTVVASERVDRGKGRRAHMIDKVVLADSGGSETTFEGPFQMKPLIADVRLMEVLEGDPAIETGEQAESLRAALEGRLSTLNPWSPSQTEEQKALADLYYKALEKLDGIHSSLSVEEPSTSEGDQELDQIKGALRKARKAGKKKGGSAGGGAVGRPEPGGEDYVANLRLMAEAVQDLVGAGMTSFDDVYDALSRAGDLSSPAELRAAWSVAYRLAPKEVQAKMTSPAEVRSVSMARPEIGEAPEIGTEAWNRWWTWDWVNNRPGTAGSKVVDSSGKPHVVVHYTKKPFPQYGEDYLVATAVSRKAQEEIDAAHELREEVGGSTASHQDKVDAFLFMKDVTAEWDPARSEAGDARWELERALNAMPYAERNEIVRKVQAGEMSVEEARAAVPEAFNPELFGTTDAGWLGRGSYFGDPGMQWFSRTGYRYDVYLSLTNPYIVGESPKPEGLPNPKQHPVKFTEALKDAGYDGVIARGEHSTMGRSDEYVAFYPEQVKSVRNRGTWEVDNPVIVESPVRSRPPEPRPLTDEEIAKIGRAEESGEAEIPPAYQGSVDGGTPYDGVTANMGPSMYEGKILSRQELTQLLMDVFPERNLVTRHGVGRRKVGGFYMVRADLIRVAQAHDVATQAHEFGHALQRAFFPEDPKSYTGYATVPADMRHSDQVKAKAELMLLGKRAYGSKKPKGGYKSEGIAEFVRLFITKPEVAMRDAPVVYAWFDAKFQAQYPDAYKRLQAYKAEFRKRVLASPEQRARADQDRADYMLTRRFRFFDYFSSMDQFMTDWVDKNYTFKELDEKAQAQAQEEDNYMFLNREGLLRPSVSLYRTAAALEMTHAARAAVFADKFTTDLAGNRVGEPLGAIKELIEHREWKDFAIYLWARRSLALANHPEFASEPEADKPRRPRLGGLSVDEALALVRNLERDRTERFRKAAMKVYRWNDDVLNYAAGASAQLARSVRRIRSIDPGQYVPLWSTFSQLDSAYQKSGGASVRDAQTGRLAKRLRGSMNVPTNVMETMLENAERIIKTTHQRVILERIYRYRNVPGLGHMIEEMPANMDSLTLPAEQVVKQLTDAIGGGVELMIPGVDELTGEHGMVGVEAEDLMHYVTFYLPVLRTGDDSVRFAMVDETPTPDKGSPNYERDKQAYGSKIKLFELKDARLLDALLGEEPHQATHVVDLVFQAHARLWRLGTVAWHASFGWVTNPQRDVRTFWMQTRTQGNPAWNLGLLKDLLGMLSSALIYNLSSEGSRAKLPAWMKENFEWIDMFFALGGEITTPVGGDIGYRRRSAARLFQNRWERARSPLNWLDALATFVQVPEGAIRATELKAIAKAKGLTSKSSLTADQAIELTEAFSEVTVNFRRGGLKARAVNRYVPFFTATINAWVDTSRAYKRNPGQFILKGLTSITLPAIASWMLMRDDEWFVELPANMKFQYLYLPLGDEVLQIRQPHETGTFFGAAVVAMLESAYRDGESAMDDLGWFALQSMLPGITPPLAGEIVEQAANEDFFFDRPIVPRREEGRYYKRDQYGPYTTQTAKALGRIFNASPRRIDHALKGTFGAALPNAIRNMESLLGLTAQVRDPEPSDFPILGKGLRRGGATLTMSKSVDRLYDLKEAADLIQHSPSVEETEPQRQMRLLLSDATRAVGMLSYVRQYTEGRAERGALTREMVDIAKKAIEAHDSEGVYTEQHFLRQRMRMLRKQAERRKELQMRAIE